MTYHASGARYTRYDISIKKRAIRKNRIARIFFANKNGVTRHAVYYLSEYFFLCGDYCKLKILLVILKHSLFELLCAPEVRLDAGELA